MTDHGRLSTFTFEELTNPSSPVCFACGHVFADAGGQALVQRHRHHIIPRAYGGEDGPLTCVCLPCHDLLHKIANKMIAGKAYLPACPKDQVHRDRILYLASRISEAQKHASRDPNKTSSLSIRLTPEIRTLLRDLKHATRSSSSEDLILRLLRSAHSSLTKKR